MTATKEAIAQVLNGVIDPNTGKGLQDSGEIASVLPGAVIIELGYPAKSQIELIKKRLKTRCALPASILKWRCGRTSALTKSAPRSACCRT